MNGLHSLETAVAALVVAWLATGLLAHPAVFGVVALFALVPLALVALPMLGVHALGERSVTVRRLPPVETVDECVPPGSRRGFPSDD